MTVDGEGRLTLAYTASNDVPKEELYKKLKSIIGELRMEPDHLFGRFAYMKNEIPVAGCAHQAGTCRFGTDPATSVLDVDCKAHELDNLYVVDTSVFPSIGAVNPALTAMANSLRVGDHLLDAWVARRWPRGRSVTEDGRSRRRASRSRSRAESSVSPSSGSAAGCARTRSAAATLLDGYRRRRDRPTSGRGQVLVPGRTGSRTGATSSTGELLQLPLTEPEHGQRDPRPRPLGGVERRAMREPDRVVLDYMLEPAAGLPVHARAQRRVRPLGRAA